MHLDDTIVAIATPPGRGGIGVVRLAGPEARAIAAPLLRLKHELAAGRAVFGELIEPDDPGERPASAGPREPDARAQQPAGAAGVAEPSKKGQRIDEVVATFFAEPHSYTTDDVVEISTHGAPVVLRHVVELCLARGARLAEPGEFTLRAFLNGRLDLTQAEAVRDLIESQTLYQAKVAAQQLEGALSRRLQPIKEQLVQLIALLEAGVDFAEDDVAVLPAGRILEYLDRIEPPLAQLLASFAYGRTVHEGMMLAIVGRPNVGKSSLFNRLVERERAIVTATPGTTRDLVSETVSLGGIPVKLVDTAGIRPAADEAESIGVKKSYEALADADLVLVVLDASQPRAAEDDALLRAAADRNRIVVANKIDLASRNSKPETRNGFVSTSATTGEGIPQLKDEILRHLGSGAEIESGFLTNVRHEALVRESLAALAAAAESTRAGVPHEMLLLDLYSALRPLDAVTGATTADDILNRIFSQFCIGK